MRYLAFLFLLVLGFGCAAKQGVTPQTAVQDVPLPQTTPFDSNPKARAAYLDSYSTFYRAYLAGHDSMPACTFGRGGIIATAREHGGWDGRVAAAQAELEAELHRKESPK